MNNTILIVDDEEDITDLVSEILEDNGYTCCTASNSVKTFEAVEKNKPTIILLDIWLQGSELDGLGILEVLREKYPYIPVIMISGHGTIETAVNAIKMGAYDYLEKPFSPDKLTITVKRALEISKLKRENLELKKKVSTKPELIGQSQALLQLKATIERIAPTSSRILIKGEYGTGKELVARVIHKLSTKKNHSFVTINAAILNNEKIKKDYLGDPTEGKFGIADLATNGTLFIDNITELPTETQKNLLKFIQGSEKSQSANKHNIRVISSASENLNEAVKSGKLMKDLLYRINVSTIEVPPLRERKEDIATLCQFFLDNIEKTEGFASKKIGEDVIAVLQSHNWPGNIRELKNLIEKLFIISNLRKTSKISVDILSDDILPKSSSMNNLSSSSSINSDIMSLPLRQAREEFERQYLSAQMARFNNNISKTSLFVGMERSALHRKLKMLNIHSNSISSEFEKEAEAVS